MTPEERKAEVTYADDLVVVLRGYLCPELMCINHADAEWEGEAFCPSCEPVYALHPVGCEDEEVPWATLSPPDHPADL